MEITLLASLIKENAQKYYDGLPCISDVEFDALVEQLRVQDPTNPIFSTIGWGYLVDNTLFETIKHSFVVGSLQKIKAGSNYLLDNTSLLMPKLDGGSGVAYYVDGRLKNIVSRGDGNEGLDITANLFHAVPKVVPPHVKWVRGEIALTYEETQDWDIAHPRNKAVGLSQSSDPDPEELKCLKFVAYGCNIELPKDEQLDFLWNLGFNSINYFKIHEDKLPSEDRDYYSILYRDRKHAVTYPTDGIVIHDLITGRELAFKFEDESAVSKVVDIHWGLSRTQRMVPVLQIEGVELEGAWISRITANNVFWLEDWNAGIGSKIKLVRANQIIPKLVDVLEGAPVNAPTNCPSCSGELTRRDSDLVCDNLSCDNIIAGLPYNALNLVREDGIGGTIMESYLDSREIFTLQQFKDKITAEPLVNDFGPSTGKKLAKMFETLRTDNFLISEILQMANVPSIGGATRTMFDEDIEPADFIKAIRVDRKWSDSFPSTTYKNQVWFDKYIDILINILDFVEDRVVKPEPKVKDSTEYTLKYCMTGSLSKTRNELVEEFKTHGLQFVDIGQAEVLICNGNRSAKVKSAESKGTKIMTEDEFRAQYC